MTARAPVLALSICAAILPLSVAAAGAHHDAHHAATTSDAAAALSSGEVRKVDAQAKKITIRHGPLENLGMPPMTMVFQVGHPALLTGVKAGDKVKFRAESQGGALIVTRLQRE